MVIYLFYIYLVVCSLLAFLCYILLYVRRCVRDDMSAATMASSRRPRRGPPTIASFTVSSSKRDGAKHVLFNAYSNSVMRIRVNQKWSDSCVCLICVKQFGIMGVYQT